MDPRLAQQLVTAVSQLTIAVQELQSAVSELKQRNQAIYSKPEQLRIGKLDNSDSDYLDVELEVDERAADPVLEGGQPTGCEAGLGYRDRASHWVIACQVAAALFCLVNLIMASGWVYVWGEDPGPFWAILFIGGPICYLFGEFLACVIAAGKWRPHVITWVFCGAALFANLAGFALLFG